MSVISWTKFSVESNLMTLSPCLPLGKGVEEIRIWDESGTYRVVYTARLINVVYVLHAFQKKTQATSKRDIELARKRYVEIIKGA